MVLMIAMMLIVLLTMPNHMIAPDVQGSSEHASQALDKTPAAGAGER